jgi:butyrate kinase
MVSKYAKVELTRGGLQRVEKIYKILVINNGSTSLKLAYYENEKKINEETIDFHATELQRFKTIYDQKEMRRQAIEDYIKRIGVPKEQLDVLVSRGPAGGDQKAGGYLIDEALVQHCWTNTNPHASNLGPIIAYELMQELKIPGYIYDSIGVNEFNEYAKLTGLKEFPLQPMSHTLNQKAVARMAAKKLGGKYQDFNFIVAHLGGGLSIALHDHGVLTDSTGDAFAPERAGGMPFLAIVNFLKEVFSGKYSEAQLIKMFTARGGLVSYLGTSDLREVEQRIAAGDKEAEFYFKAMVYQIAKCIGGMATVACGKIDRVILTGGLTKSRMLTEQLQERVSFIAPVEIYPGAFEMEALALGTLRIVRGEEQLNQFGA